MEGLSENKKPTNPREKATFFSYLVFWWVLPIFFKGRKKELEEQDLYEALKCHKSDYLGDLMCKSWEHEIRVKKELGKKPSLLRAALRVFGGKIMLLGLFLAAIEFLLKVSQPLFLGGLISYYSSSNGVTRDAYLYAGAVVLCSALSVLFMHSFMLSNLHEGMKLRVSMCSMIYRKALRLSKNALGDTTVGQVVNLLSNDVGRLDLSIIFLHYLWVGPLETFVVTYLMYREVGVSAVFGVIFLLLFIPLQAYLGKKTSVLRLKTALRTDERVRLMNEIIQGIQVIKMYAWEKPFGKLVERTRIKELKVIRYVSYIRGILLSFIIFSTRVSVFISLIAFALLGNVVTAEKAFVITAYYNILRQTMTIFFPQAIAQLAETIVSVKRIQKYMLYNETDLGQEEPITRKTNASLNEKEPNSAQSTVTTGYDDIKYIDSHESLYEPSLESQSVNGSVNPVGVTLKSLTAKWDYLVTENTLDDISLQIKPSNLVAIIGPVGAGKSSLIQAILGELPALSGRIDISGVMSYASQEPWLFSGTIRQNILFGQSMDKKRYREVVKRCALEKDFSLFANGDKTIVGERGQSLSGGQKARISLARAVYRQAAIYLLDDPLSAVDTHVGRHLFDQCMRIYLRGKIVILVTHQLQYLQHADQIVILDKGRVQDVGTYENLKESGLDFAQLLRDSKEEDKAEEGEENRSRSGSKTYQRRISESSLESLEMTHETPLQNEEARKEGSVGFEMYKKYFQASGGFCAFYWMMLFCVTAQLAASAGDYFLTYWVNKEEQRNLALVSTNKNVANESNINLNQPVVSPSALDYDGFIAKIIKYIDGSEYDNYMDIYIFTGLTVATVVITLSRSFIFFNLAVRAAKTLHNAMYMGVTRASMYFFNTNPSGRILNRFSKDMGQVDEFLPTVMIDVIQIFLSLAGIIVVVAVVNYWLMIPTLIIGIIFYFLRNFYLTTSRCVKRIEATTRSPIYSHLGATLTGLSTIRAFRTQRVLIKEFDCLQDLNSSAFYVFISTSRAFGFWLDAFCVLYIAIVTLSFFLMGDAYGGNVGLAITQAIGMTGMVQWGMRQSAELENTMTAVERVVEYQSVDPEGEREAFGDKKPQESWPEEGRVIFDHLSLRYFPTMDADRVLKELEFEIKPQEKIGIVGRTGAGKSSLINALFRLSYNDGSILIDGRDTGVMGLHDLRKKISIIPQEPVLFSGSMRYNLDPFDEYPDEKLWKALEDVKLKTVIVDLPSGLQSKISEGGSNFSVGQRQLVCLARALLRENKILVMDEATANVDPQTDNLIQATIREMFANCTVLTIAHRLNTVMDSDRVLVMDAGRVVEFAPPYELLTGISGCGMFENMLQETGKGTYDQLLEIARRNYEKNSHVEVKRTDIGTKK
ncbi:probable multidrug resistance-associated protein lethal(2)03659 isoform X2 [Phlebotomus argentipes]|uniref:probable multidrug resistance-associated protein lethal(2)03659 isoform X2 n=1 Tax=Phlebotomus argentipes TaxID=94469 RepID=UPI0028930306|nr:probable multidrug resistance-associated protein lethal(2)03659 isoform X2 [Phlebotomus argentipes]